MWQKWPLQCQSSSIFFKYIASEMCSRRRPRICAAWTRSPTSNNNTSTMANFVMSKARRLFSYTDLEGPNNNMAMETTSISIGDSPSPEHSGIILLTYWLFWFSKAKNTFFFQFLWFLRYKKYQSFLNILFVLSFIGLLVFLWFDISLIF